MYITLTDNKGVLTLENFHKLYSCSVLSVVIVLKEGEDTK